MRRLMLLLLSVAMIGTAVDLMLLDHHEDFWQMVPLGVIALGVVSVMLSTIKGGVGSVMLMRVTMALFVCSGFVGMGLHYIGNNEFQLEMDPSLREVDYVEGSAGAGARGDDPDGTPRPAVYV
jgi:hypothetical protein